MSNPNRLTPVDMVKQLGAKMLKQPLQTRFIRLDRGMVVAQQPNTIGDSRLPAVLQASLDLRDQTAQLSLIIKNRTFYRVDLGPKCPRIWPGDQDRHQKWGFLRVNDAAAENKDTTPEDVSVLLGMVNE